MEEAIVTVGRKNSPLVGQHSSWQCTFFRTSPGPTTQHHWPRRLSLQDYRCPSALLNGHLWNQPHQQSHQQCWQPPHPEPTALREEILEAQCLLHYTVEQLYSPCYKEAELCLPHPLSLWSCLTDVFILFNLLYLFNYCVIVLLCVLSYCTVSFGVLKGAL